MAGGTAGPRQPSRKRAKPAAPEADQPPAQGTKEPSPRSRTVASTRALKTLKEKSPEKVAAAAAAAVAGSSPAAKKNLQRLFQQTTDQLDPPKLDLRIGGSSILFRAFLLLIAAAALTSTLRNLRENQARFPEMPSTADPTEVENFMRKTTRWIETQLDSVDEKINQEIYAVRGKLEEALSQKTQKLESDLKDIKTYVDSVENSIKTLQSDDILSKEEALELVKLALEDRSESSEKSALSLDDVRVAARKLVRTELETHSADGIGRVDFALGSGGGKVVHHSEGVFHGLHWTGLGSFLIPGVFKRHPMADRVLKPSFGEPGQCLPLKGGNVTVDVKLRCHVHPEAVTLEHLSKRVAYDASSAPREFQVSGWSDRVSPRFNARSSTWLGDFTYSLDKGSVQTFEVEKSGAAAVNMIRLRVTSNYGGPHTCLYRFRVHGTAEGVGDGE